MSSNNVIYIYHTVGFPGEGKLSQMISSKNLGVKPKSLVILLEPAIRRLNQVF